jgi:hypothetical protein
VKADAEHRAVVAGDERPEPAFLEEQALRRAAVGAEEGDAVAFGELGETAGGLRGGGQVGGRRTGQGDDGRRRRAPDAVAPQPDVAAALVAPEQHAHVTADGHRAADVGGRGALGAAAEAGA